jgi:hypothetical protein
LNRRPTTNQLQNTTVSYLLKVNSISRPLLFLMIDAADHISPKTGLAPAATISRNGGSFNPPSGTVAEIGNGWYQVAGNASDTATVGPLLLHATAPGADPTDVQFEVVAFDPGDATRLGLQALPGVAAGGNGGLPTGDTAGRVLLQPAQPGVTIPAVTNVANVAGGVTVAANADKSGYSLTPAERTGIAGAVISFDLASLAGTAARSVGRALWRLFGYVKGSASLTYPNGDTATITQDATTKEITSITAD